MKTLLEDYEFPVIPNTCKTTLIGHMGNVKTAIFSGPEGDHVISGSGDNTVRVWDTQTGTCQSILHGHTSRIWSVASWNEGEFIASGSGDSTIKVSVCTPLFISNSLINLIFKLFRQICIDMGLEEKPLSPDPFMWRSRRCIFSRISSHRHTPRLWWLRQTT